MRHKTAGERAMELWVASSKKERSRMKNVALQDMPRTIALLEKYPAGPEREQAFELLCTGIDEANVAIHREVTERFSRFASLAAPLNISDYLKP